jgi:outer membrane protein OmpA-like peptidoglycan-associated protein
MWWWVAGLARASDVDLFDPSSSFGAGLGTVQGESPLLGPAGPSAGLLLSHAQDPVVRRFADGTEEPAVQSVTPVMLSGGWTVPGRVRANLFVPVYPWVEAPLSGFSGAAFGNVRAQALVPAWASGDGRTTVGVVPRLTLPIGSREAQVNGGFTGELVAALDTRLDDVSLLWNVNLVGAPNRALEGSDVGLGSTLGTLVGVSWQATETFRVGGEADLDLGLARGPGGANRTGAAHAFVQSVLPSGVGVSGGVGSGVLRGVGSPAFRVFAAVTYVTVDPDPDRDGILRKVDACPAEAEDPDGFEDADGCRDPDNDADGVVDDDDRCPADPEDADGWEDADGCPDPDNDLDTVLDGDDACPTEKGSVPAWGCPDRDEDAIVDAEDACPDLPGVAAWDGCTDRDGDQVPEPRDVCPDQPIPAGADPATSDGCPPKVVATPAPAAAVYRKGSEIAISDRIEFEIGKAELRPKSLPILDQVVAVMRDNPNVGLVEVQGHTDNVGSDASNLTLSQERAESVVDYLVSKGVARERLTPKGYGETAPMFTNRTESGRVQNRRVQFVILEATVRDTVVSPPAKPAPTAPKVVPAAPAPAPAAPPAPLGPPGRLTVVLPPEVWASVLVDGAALGDVAPFAGVSVPAGEHTIRVQNPRLRLDWSQTVTVAPGAVVRLAPLGEPAPAPAPAPEEDPWAVDDEVELGPTSPAPAPSAPDPAPADKPTRKSKKR